ncbi:hypothetical protein L484_015422 [Morus notabilis]|uniref:Uncharacterized protein n=1 Tax=Morus notabilis TaxID=981085 RepID=W9RRF8_9ROSA|nr:hypothetical protein L484_015422 [Morus notabilis]
MHARGDIGMVANKKMKEKGKFDPFLSDMAFGRWQYPAEYDYCDGGINAEIQMLSWQLRSWTGHSGRSKMINVTTFMSHPERWLDYIHTSQASSVMSIVNVI